MTSIIRMGCISDGILIERMKINREVEARKVKMLRLIVVSKEGKIVTLKQRTHLKSGHTTVTR